MTAAASASSGTEPSSIPLAIALQLLHAARGNDVVLTSMGTGRDWQALPPHPLDLVQIPSSMGQTPAWGLGIALAQPSRRVIVCCGDGSLLMNLGCLVTIANVAPENFTLLVFDNGMYEVTGRQPTPAFTAGSHSGHPADLGGIAREAGMRHVECISCADHWRQRVDEVIRLPGPVCIVLRVTPVAGNPHVRARGVPGSVCGSSLPHCSVPRRRAFEPSPLRSSHFDRGATPAAWTVSVHGMSSTPPHFVQFDRRDDEEREADGDQPGRPRHRTGLQQSLH